MLAAIGRMTVAATDLEHYLAWIGADRAGGDARAVFESGQSYEAARGSVEFSAPAVREELIRSVEAAGTQLALGRSELRRLWASDNPPGPEVFNDRAVLLVRCRGWLEMVIAEHMSL
jgi:hypothetical protein